MKCDFRVFEDRFRTVLIALLALLFIARMMMPAEQAQDKEAPGDIKSRAGIVHVFYHPTCPHCRDALDFLHMLRETGAYEFEISTYNIENEAARKLFVLTARNFGYPQSQLATPFIVIGDHHHIGFDTAQTSGETLTGWIAEMQNGAQNVPETTEATSRRYEHLDLPYLGTVNPYEMSLPVLAAALGLVDGFNPCAMWVLVYLISLIIGMKDRRRIYTLVGTFLMASGILYFLFMAAWLNLFLMIGYIRVVSVLIGVAALYMGITNIRDFAVNGGQVVCEIGDLEERRKTRSKIRELVTSPMSLATFGGIVVLAFAVNSIEFLCSSALPAVFTHVLTLEELPAATYYLYILLYVLFFMLDDLVIFGAAAVATEKFIGEKYAGYCHVIGGGVLILMGIYLVFFQQNLP